MTEQPDFVALCNVDDVRPGEAVTSGPPRASGASPMAVWNENGEYHITNYVCPHSGGPLSEGKIENGVIECPWHGWQFNVGDGSSARGDGHSIATTNGHLRGRQVSGTCMGPVTISRRFDFSSSHRYYRDDWSEEENRRVFGLCALPNGLTLEVAA